MRQLILRRLFMVGAGVLGLLWLGQVLRTQALQVQAAPSAPTVTVLTPQGAVSDIVGEGDDYFTQVQHNPRDMNDNNDLMWQVFGISNISYADGVWSGTTANSPAGSYSSIYMIYPGFSLLPTGGANDASVAEVGQSGWNYPVNADKYKLLSFRLKTSAALPNSPWDRWWHAAYTNYSFTNEIAHYEGFYPITGADSWQVYTAAMPWTGTMYGLEYRFGLGTGPYQFDWVRLTDPATSPMYTVTFSVAGAQAGDVVDLDCYMAASATPDDYCGPIAKDIPTSASTTYEYYWRTTYLPPGQYYVKATARRDATASSDMSDGALTIQGAPLLSLDSPSMTSGPDYATVELGNPWDMNDSSDIFTSLDSYRPPHDFDPATQCPCFANGEMYGTVGRFSSKTSKTGDPFVYLKVGYQRPIDTAKYKYLTYRYKVDRASWWSNSGDRLSSDPTRNGVFPAGWLVRAVFFHSWFLDLAHSNTTNDIVIFDDWNTYQMDLSQGRARGYWEPQVIQPGGYWTGLKTAFRFDLLEGVDPWVVHLDDVKLTGDDTANASYQVKWSVLSSAGPTTIDFYRSTDRSTCLTSGTWFHQWTSDTTPPPPPPGLRYHIYLPLIFKPDSSGANSFVWSTADVPAGTYYVCATVSDGYNTSTVVSNAAVIIAH